MHQFQPLSVYFLIEKINSKDATAGMDDSIDEEAHTSMIVNKINIKHASMRAQRNWHTFPEIASISSVVMQMQIPCWAQKNAK